MHPSRLRALSLVVLQLTLPLPALAATRRVVVSSGDCQDAELAQQARSFQETLASRPDKDVLNPQDVGERLRPSSPRSAEEIQRQLDAAQDQFYEGRNARATQALDDALRDIGRLPVGDARWTLYARAKLLHGLNHRAANRVKESDAAFRDVLRLQPGYTLDEDSFAPSARQAFDKVRKDLAKTRKVKLSVKSTLAASDVYLDGLRVGQTPLSVEVPPGTYDLTLVRGGAVSFARQVQAQGADTPILVDLAYEGSVSTTPFPCIATADGRDEQALGHAVRLGGTLGVEDVIVVRLEPPSRGPKWFAATVLNVEGGQKLREGGFKTQDLKAPPEALSALADFVTTGRSPSDLVVMNASGPAPWEQPAVVSAPVAADAPKAVGGLSEEAKTSVPRSTSGLRVASYVALGAGAAALAGAGVVRLMAQGDANDLNKRLNANGHIPSDDAEAVKLRDSLAGKSGLLTGLLVGGGAAVVTGGVLYLLSPTKAPALSVGVAGDGSGAGASVSGAF